MSEFLSFARRRWYLLAAVLVLAIAISIRQYSYQGVNGDPYIYWAVGGKFLADKPLYEPVPGSQEFLYPPVAVLFCQILALMPFPVAVVVFTLFNFAAWLVLIGLTYKLLRFYFPKADLRLAMLVGFVASIRYFWHNILWVNVNEIIALLCFGGLYTYLKGHRLTALALLSLAMWIKVMALLLVVTLAFRRPKQTVIPAVGFTILFALIVMGFRGVNQGIQDYFDYWNITFKPFLTGKVFTDWIAFGISPLLSKLLTAHEGINGIQYNIVSWPPALVGKISLVIRIVIMGITYRYVWLTRKQRQLPLHAILLTFLTMLLVSGVAWEGHHVTLLLIVAGLYHLLTVKKAVTLRRWMTIIAIAIGLMTSDLLGNRLSDYTQAFTLITYNVLFLYVVAVWLSERSLKQMRAMTAQLESRYASQT
ncbi:glycosyltransferase family 87 protein [uncultured Fibrella sp.]|uniref:glycosyltransferase family 87 protein n=1 Tax=uncultured Fibrella sp. TaxID=1284596 RepID=UPI0035CAB266